MTEQKIKAFFSWQSDIQNQTQAIRSCLKEAVSLLDKKGFDVEIDEATRDAPGAPYIPGKITEKIDSTDIFIGDVSIINADHEGRKTPNPNVVFELGYAVATIGWDRVILILSVATGALSDLPFDFDRHRAMRATIPDTPKHPARSNFVKFLVEALELIASKNPKRPFELKNKTAEQIQRERDISSLRWLLERIHFPTVDGHVERAPHYLSQNAVAMADEISAVTENSLFHIYDSELREAVDRFGEAWKGSFDDRFYHETHSGDYVFTNPGDTWLTGQKKEAWDAIEAALKIVRAAKDDLLRIIRERYIEIDIHETNKNAFNRLKEWRREVDD